MKKMYEESKMKRIDNLVQLLCDHLPSTKYQAEFLKLLLTKGKATLQTNVGLPDEESNIHDDLVEGYDAEIYAGMHRDKVRNAFFQKAIRKASKRCHKWVEIGPGGLGTLSHMVLDANARNTLHSVEAVPRSVSSLRKLFRREPRFHVVQGLAGTTPLPTTTQPFQALVAEILGHFASLEGYVAILHACAENYPSFSNIKVAIPRVFGTKIVPVDLSRATYLKIARIHANLVLINHFPLHDTELSSTHGTMEMYDAMTEMERRCKRPRVFKNTWKMLEERPFHGFSCYLVFGEDETHLTTSLQCENWSQIFIVVGGGTLVCQPGDSVKVTTTCHVHVAEPSYDFSVLVQRGGRNVHKEEIHLRYKDIMSSAYPLRALKP